MFRVLRRRTDPAEGRAPRLGVRSRHRDVGVSCLLLLVAHAVAAGGASNPRCSLLGDVMAPCCARGLPCMVQHSALRSARLPVKLIGSPINSAKRLIGSPITLQSMVQQFQLIKVHAFYLDCSNVECCQRTAISNLAEHPTSGPHI